MKKTFIAFLVLAGVGYAAPLNKEDWKYVGVDEAPDGVFDFKDGTLDITSNTNGKKLGYVTDGSNPMVNGSGLSITFQFDTDTFLNDIDPANSNSRAQLTIYLYGEGENEIHALAVMNNNPNFNIYEMGGSYDVDELVDNDVPITSITVNYTIRDDKLWFNYLINDSNLINGTNKVREDVVAGVTLDTTLDWRPVFGCSHTAKTNYTVTDVTFISVPEPTTAVLSLLALAGLAARRRR